MTATPAFVPAQLVGRQAVLDTLDGFVRRLEDGVSDIAVVTGPVGSGRSAVLDRVVDRARASGLAVGVARCSPRESQLPYGAITQLLGTLCRPSRIGALASGIGPTSRPTDTVARMCDTLLTLSAGRPVLLAVDDLHLADPHSLRRLVDLIHRARQGAVLGLVTSPVPVRQVLDAAGARPAAPSSVHTLRLDALTTAEARSVVEARVGHPVQRSVLTVAGVAGWSPAVLHAVADRITALGRPLDTDAVPQLIAAARTAWSTRALTTLHGLPKNVVALLRATAVGGHQLEPARLAALAGLDATAFADAVDALRACGLLADTDIPRLRHPWFADDVLAGMTGPERDRLHRRAASLHGQEGARVGTVAEMLGDVTSLVRSWTASDLAASSRPRHTADVTTASLRHSLCEPVTEAERARRLIRLATAEAVTAPQAADGRLRQVMLRHLSRETWPDVLNAADLLLSRGDAETARWVIADVHQRALTKIPDEELRPLRALGRLAHKEKGGLPLVAPPPVHSDRTGHPAQSAVLAWTLATRGDERDRVLELARTALDEPATVPFMCRIAAARALLSADDIPAGLDRLDAVAADARGADALAAAAQALLSRAEEQIRLGHGEEALRELTAATRALPPASWHSLLAPRLAAAEVLALLRCGRVDEARRASERARSRPEGHSVTTAFLLYARAELALIDGDAARALLLLEECGRMLRAKRWRNPMLIAWRSAAAVAHHHLGAATTADDLLMKEREVAERWGTPGAFTALRARTLEALARNGVEVPRAYAGSVPSARSSYDAPAAMPDATAPAPDPLTPSERDVADLVLAGLANREIARRLGLATRTVELRLTHTYRKLGVKGRAALVAHLRARQEDH
ncbi:AAA family ATPase [Streptomyces chartreusis]|uniref:AAA family ATPase n=1 Tax=Streptomyces chartreusis TaxID=1969 RepID=UPI002F9113E5|nr:LuxR C-terminal-related transcriptional regulator [Streptomyces chartreusis]WTA33218.1 LuxR C-terminal-related transcriptional regulator [Streptomyces chartreusis]